MTQSAELNPVKVLVVPAAGLMPSYTWPFRLALRRDYNYDSVGVDLRPDDIDADFSDEARYIHKAAGNSESVFIAAESRGGEGAVRAASEFEKRGEIARLKGITLINFAGPHGWRLNSETREEAARNRLTEEFRAARNDVSDHLTFYNAERLAEISDIDDPDKLRRLMGSMCLQRTAEISSSPLADLPEGLPLFTIQAVNDRVLNIRRAVQLHLDWLNKSQTMVAGGHFLLLQKDKEMAAIVGEQISSVENN